MHRMILTVAGVFSASGLLLVDSAVKGTVLLALAAVAALLFRRDSAATRHLVWLLAIVALLVLPLMSAALPQWRVLPEWAGLPWQTPAAIPSSVNGSVTDAMDLASNAEPVEVEPISANTIQPAAVLPDSRPATITPQARPESAAGNGTWVNLLPLVWCVGFLVLILRLMAARWMLWSTERRGIVICPARQPANEQSPSETCDLICTAFDAACLQLGINRPVTLLIHQGDAIPAVWGILRSRLLLPAAARHWSSEQLRSVLLHELAHIQRRDMLTQLLTQIACALHWFNPLVWFAAWRLGVERERACDDLVLASGVRPSAYAGHLLDVATAHSPAPWTEACGLAMARPSSLEGRLVAVLSEKLNRRGVPASLAAVALAIGAGLAVPIAMLRAADEKQQESTATSEVKTSAVPADDTKPETTIDDLLEKFSNAATFWEQGEVARKLIATGDTTIIRRIEKHLDTPDRRKRCNAALVLAGLADQRGLAIMIGELEDTQPRPTDLKRSDGKPYPDGQIRDDRYYAALLLGELRKKEAVPALIEATKDESVSGRAATSLGEIGDRSAIPALRKMATDFPAQRLWADYGLAALGEQEGFDHLGELALSEPGWTERRHAVEALAKIGNPVAVPVLVKALKDKHANVRVSAAIALGKIGDPAALPALTAALSDTEATEVNAPTTVKSEAQKAIDAIKKKPRTENQDVAAPANAGPTPKHESAQVLFKIWQEGARTDGKIPGGVLRSLAAAVENFIKLNPTNEKVPQLSELRKRIDFSHDWSPADAVALLDDLTAIHPTLPDSGHPPGRRGVGGSIRPGSPLPAEFANVPWGEPAANGLRAAFLVEPAARQYPLGANLKARILFHNSGKKTVLFRTPDWHQYLIHQARDANGARINVGASNWLRLTSLVNIRLAPGEFAEVETTSIVIGPREQADGNWTGLRLGSWILAKAGDEVTVQPSAVTASEEPYTAPAERRKAVRMWFEIVNERIDREGPLPAAAADREKLIRRVTPDLLGVPPTKQEINTFVADDSPHALSALVNSFLSRVAPFSGVLPVREIKFRVTAADPDAAKKPRVATGLGQYDTGDKAWLDIVRKADGARRIEARIMHKRDPKTEPQGRPYHISSTFELPEGHFTWAIAWEPGTTILWVTQKGLFRKFDFANSAQVQETRFEADEIVNVPQQIRDAVKAALALPGAPVQQPEPLK